MKALILAGGFGTRLKPLTNSIPKPILPICNRPFLTYQIELLKRTGIKQVILSIHHQSDKIIDVLSKESHLGVKLEYIVEPKPLGTAGAFKFAEKYLDDTTIVLNGDSLMDFDLIPLIKTHKERGSQVTIALTRVKDTSAYGLVEKYRDGRVKRFIEKSSTNMSSSNTINAGVYIIESDLLNFIPKKKYFMFEKDLFPYLLKIEAKFHTYLPNKRYWIDIGSPQSFLKANLDFLNNKTISFNVSHNFFVESDNSSTYEKTLVGTNSRVAPGCNFIESVIGENCIIGRNVKLYRSVILSNCKISDNSQISSSIIGTNTNISNNCSLRFLLLGQDSYISSDTSTISIS